MPTAFGRSMNFPLWHGNVCSIHLKRIKQNDSISSSFAIFFFFSVHFAFFDCGFGNSRPNSRSFDYRKGKFVIFVFFLNQNANECVKVWIKPIYVLSIARFKWKYFNNKNDLKSTLNTVAIILILQSIWQRKRIECHIQIFNCSYH